MKLFKMFLAFFKIGFFTVGGGYAMLPVIQKEIVDKNEWLSEDEFLDAIAISQSSPGAIAVNISIFIGYNMGGFLGSLVCTLGTVLPSFLIILIVAMFLYQFRDITVVEKVFMGIRPAIVSLIGSSVISLFKPMGFEVQKIVFAIVSFILIVFLGVSPVLVIVIGGILSPIYYNFMDKKEESNEVEEGDDE